jgi:peptide/nickel transport system substrate-binding protein
VKAGSSDRQVVVTYSKPFVAWKSTVLPFFPQHIMDQGDAAKNCAYITKGWPTQQGFPQDFTGGPWQLLKKNINFGQKTYVLTPNPKWWGAGTGLQRLVYRNLGSDAGVLTKALQADEVQVIYPQPQTDLVSQVRAMQPKVTSNITFGLSFEHLDMNTRNPDLAHVEVRKAIATALNRQDLVSRTIGQFDARASVLNNRYFVTNQTQYKDNSGNLYSKQDIPKAKQLIESVGYKMGSDGIYALNGHRLSLELMTTVNNKLRANTIDIITAQLKLAGIEIKKSLNPNIFAGADEDKHSLEGGKFDMALFAWVSSPTLAGNVPIYQSVKGDAQGQNYSHGNDPKADELMGKMLVETDPAKAADLANQVDAQLWTDMYTLPLYQKATFIAFSSKLAPYNKDTGSGIADNASQDGPAWNSSTWTHRAARPGWLPPFGSSPPTVHRRKVATVFVYCVRRVLSSALVLLASSFLVFLLAASTLDPLARLRQKQGLAPGAIDAQAHLLGLDKPAPQRYWSWLTGVLHGDFGNDINGNAINPVLFHRVIVTGRLVLAAMVLATVLAVAVGVCKKNKRTKVR